MRKFLLLTTAIGLLCMLHACSEETYVNEHELQKEVKFTASIKSLTNDLKISTRATGSSWDDNDVIGVFMKDAGNTLPESALAVNRKYIVGEKGAISAANEEDKIYYPFNEKEVDFISYYPYQDNLDDNLSFLIDVSDQNKRANFDILYSSNASEVNSSSEEVNLEFKYQLPKIVLNIINSTEKELDKNFSVKITMPAQASFSLIDGEIKLKEEEEREIDFIIDIDEDKTRAEAILLPHINLENLKLVIEIGSTKYSNYFPIDSFKVGKQHEFNVTITPGKGPFIDGITASITDREQEKGDDFNVIEEPANGEGSNNGGDKGEGDEDDNDGDENGEDNKMGDGSQENPYSVGQVQKMKEYSNEDIWLEGYIVGYYSEKRGNAESFENNNNPTSNAAGQRLALAESIAEQNGGNTYFILSKDSKLETTLNLHTNSSLFKQKVLLLGQIGDPLNTNSNYCLKNISTAIIDGEEYPKK